MGGLVVLALASCGPGGAKGDPTGNPSAAGTDQAASPITILMTIEPLTIGASTVTARVSDETGPLAGADVAVRGEMTHAGMAPTLGALAELEPGEYAMSDFQLSMAGDWIISVEVTAEDGRTATSETFVSVSAR